MKLKFETGTIADALRRAAAIAPTSGDSFDICHGIVLESDSSDAVVVRASNLNVYHVEEVPLMSDGSDGVPGRWRLPSILLSSTVMKMPKKSGSTITMEDSGKEVIIKCDRSVMRLIQSDISTYPQFGFTSFSEEGYEVANLAGKMNRLKWAISGMEGAFSGIYLRNDTLYATNRFWAARLRLESSTGIDAGLPVTHLAKVLPIGLDVKMQQSGGMVVISTNPSTQIYTSVFDPKEYPNIDAVLDRKHECVCTFNKADLIAMADKAAPFFTQEGQPLNMYLGSGELAVLVAAPELGSFGDVIKVKGDPENHKRILFKVSPIALKSAVESMPDLVTMRYTPNVAQLHFDDLNYSCAITLIKDR